MMSPRFSTLALCPSGSELGHYSADAGHDKTRTCEHYCSYAGERQGSSTHNYATFLSGLVQRHTSLVGWV